jgi:hypothetical protein
MSDTGIIAYESRSYGPHGQIRENHTRHIFTGGAVEGSRTLCGRTITNGNSRFRWTGIRFELDGRNPGDVDCLQCLADRNLKKLGYVIRKISAIEPSITATAPGYTEYQTRTFVRLHPQTRQDAHQAAPKPETAPDAPLVADTPPASNLVPPTSTGDSPVYPETDGHWPIPTPEEMQRTLEHLWQGYPDKQEGRLRDSVESNIGSAVRLGRFITPQDWQRIAFAVNAWTIALYISNEYDPLSTTLLNRAARRAASIWNK